MSSIDEPLRVVAKDAAEYKQETLRRIVEAKDRERLHTGAAKRHSMKTRFVIDARQMAIDLSVILSRLLWSAVPIPPRVQRRRLYDSDIPRPAHTVVAQVFPQR